MISVFFFGRKPKHSWFCMFCVCIQYRVGRSFDRTWPRPTSRWLCLVWFLLIFVYCFRLVNSFCVCVFFGVNNDSFFWMNLNEKKNLKKADTMLVVNCIAYAYSREGKMQCSCSRQTIMLMRTLFTDDDDEWGGGWCWWKLMADDRKHIQQRTMWWQDMSLLFFVIHIGFMTLEFFILWVFFCAIISFRDMFCAEKTFQIVSCVLNIV